MLRRACQSAAVPQYRLHRLVVGCRPALEPRRVDAGADDIDPVTDEDEVDAFAPRPPPPVAESGVGRP